MAISIKKHRKDLSLREKRRILESYDKLPGVSQRIAAEKLNISQPVLCNILKNRSSIESARENANRKRARGGKNSQVETALTVWFRDARDKCDGLNGRLIREKAEELARSMGNDNFKATDGWFSRWKKRVSIAYDRRGVDAIERCEAVLKEEAEEDPPTVDDMKKALEVLRRGVQHWRGNIDKHYDYERFIEVLLRGRDDPLRNDGKREDLVRQGREKCVRSFSKSFSTALYDKIMTGSYEENDVPSSVRFWWTLA